MDQRRLPHRQAYIRCRDARSVAKAIRDMALRGAPLIGCAAAYGYALAAKALSDKKHAKKYSAAARWRVELELAAKTLLDSRPTAVNLRHAVSRMQAKAETFLRVPSRLRARAPGRSRPALELFRALEAEADAMFEEDLRTNRRIAELGAELIPPGSAVMTICNTGALATCGVGTAFGVIRRAFEQGKLRMVYACETRPYLQGSRLTMWELMRAKIASTLVTDNMAAHLMARARIAAVLVGADRIAANGDTANKIGTYGLAILARHHRIPFYVVAPTTTVDLATARGADIPIEERGAGEVLRIGPVRIAPKGARALHPAFDVTPCELITAIVTERGIVRPVNGKKLLRIAASPAPAAPSRPLDAPTHYGRP